ncbi:Origin recognition complex subunit 4 [Trichinella pseudospiralis]|uniref:Origin recognition complex subunit 4 n=1 Tax=Trichinella pseudospiralis TaxID=6337 RepID=A0A0V1EU06_TRIPS|nr:Origin recognition complex subunit 4 [Trichinella pseudospiralis]KRZ44718.1 Origin recognition complex subunit 4 [Trichinella pseudospiralis]
MLCTVFDFNYFTEKFYLIRLNSRFVFQYNMEEQSEESSTEESPILDNLWNETIRFPEYVAIEKKVISFADRLASFGESNSVLILGPSGCGKSSVVIKVIDHVKRNLSKPKYKVVCIEINGLLISNVSSTLKNIIQQLKRNINHGLTEISAAEDVQSLINTLIKYQDRNHIALLIVMDYFEKFTSLANHKLLYSLLDVTQHTVMPLLLFGLSQRMDVMDFLEKRVRSRLSQIQFTPFALITFDQYYEAVKSFLWIQNPENVDNKTLAKWRKSVEHFLAKDEVRKIFKKQFEINNTAGDLKILLQFILSSLDDCCNNLSNALTCAWDLISEKRSCTLLQGLSVLEMVILMGTAILEEINTDEHPVNFEIVCRRARLFLSKHCQTIPRDRSYIWKAFQRLLERKIIVITESAISKGNKPVQFHNIRLQVEPNDVRKLIKEILNQPGPSANKSLIQTDGMCTLTHEAISRSIMTRIGPTADKRHYPGRSNNLCSNNKQHCHCWKNWTVK